MKVKPSIQVPKIDPRALMDEIVDDLTPAGLLMSQGQTSSSLSNSKRSSD
jgi:hypothetical protein